MTLLDIVLFVLHRRLFSVPFGLCIGCSHLKNPQPEVGLFLPKQPTVDDWFDLRPLGQEKKQRPWFGPADWTILRCARRPHAHMGGVRFIVALVSSRTVFGVKNELVFVEPVKNELVPLQLPSARELLDPE